MASAVFKEFLGKRVIEYITSEKRIAAHSGEMKPVTVLFSDIQGFTAFSEKFSPEDIIETLNDYLNGMATVIENNGGEIDKFIGDAIMAVFPAQPDKKASALNAVLSAAAMLEEQYMFNKMMLDRKKAPVHTGIGIHTGEVIAGTMGSNTRKDFTVIGDVVNTASRIEGLTRQYGVSILVSEAVYQLTEDNARLHYRLVDRVRVKGRETPIKVFELFKTGKLDTWEAHVLSAYNEAVKLYFSGQFQEALECFTKLEEEKSAVLYQLYISRCKSCIATPPPDGWDGTTTMQTK